MTVSARHLFQQGPMLLTLGRTALGPLARRLPLLRKPSPPAEIVRQLPPRPAALIEDFVRECGGDSARWRGSLPPHLFPQWSLPVAAEVMGALPYPLHRMLNAGCRLELRRPIPAGEPLQVRARLGEVEADEYRAKIRGIVTTGTADDPDALEATIEGYIPLTRRPGGAKKEKQRVPETARLLEEWTLPRRAGLDFALLTGDFNPLHWVPPYARAMGFRSNILHGYAQLARALEGIVSRELGGNPSRLASLEVRFTEPLVLPAKASLFLGSDGAFFVGRAPGEPANLTGRFERR